MTRTDVELLVMLAAWCAVMFGFGVLIDKNSCDDRNGRYVLVGHWLECEITDDNEIRLPLTDDER
jgi:hypothetical protein